MHYCAAKVQRNYNYYNGYFNECLPKIIKNVISILLLSAKT